METRKEDGGEIVSESSSSPFDSLPVDLISKIISFTSPRDVCVVALVSKIFDSVVKSDSAWEKFLPPEYESLFPKSRDFSSKKELYLALCNDPVIFDDAKKSFWLEKASGKICMSLSTMDMYIVWGENPQCWQWIEIPESRFEKVVELLQVYWFEIRGKMNTHILSPRTRYSAYIVFKKKDHFYGFEDLAVEAGVEVVGESVSKRLICFGEKCEGSLVKAKGREDGWMEIELGEFFNIGGLENIDHHEIHIGVWECVRLSWKCGLIIQGFEIRPAKIL